MRFRTLTAHFQPKLWSNLGLAALCLLVGTLGFLAMKAGGQQLLEAEARIDAARWSKYLSENAWELRSIAEDPVQSREAIAPLKRSIAGDYVVSFRVYDANGLLKMQAGAGAGGLVGAHISRIDPGFAQALASRTATTQLREALIASKPRFIASALVPIEAEGRIAGWLVVNLDQTERRELYSHVTAQAAIAVLLLLIAAPAFGFWYHARNKAQLERTLAAMSQRDQMTGLMLKPALLEQVEEHLKTAPPADQPCALILCELTGAAAIASAHGQHTEEEVIRHAARRLTAIVGESALIATAGRASFLLYVKNAADPMAVLSLAKDITLALGAEAVLDSMRIACACNSGIALSSSNGHTATQLMRAAELALVSAREQGTPGYGFYNPDQARNSERRLAVQAAVTEATVNGKFRLDFQPVYNIRTGELNGFEALIRLHDPELGNISPAEFIPIAEQASLINQIGAWALDEAARIAAQWPPHLMVAVNLSPSQFLSGTLINDVRRALESHQFPGYRLEVEITEGTLMNESELVMSQLRVLRDMGVAVALDDFGTGYSSLSYLWKFPFSKLKIDRSFINALDESASAKGILRSIVKLGHGLGLTVTAEGIENARQLNTLRDLGCDLAQGFLLDRPARVADLAAIILRNFANGLNRRMRDTASGKTAA